MSKPVLDIKIGKKDGKKRRAAALIDPEPCKNGTSRSKMAILKSWSATT